MQIPRRNFNDLVWATRGRAETRGHSDGDLRLEEATGHFTKVVSAGADTGNGETMGRHCGGWTV
jgi:hypothetical protein